ncbi:MAG: hypothetical protein ACREPM_07080, partial [Gemmatimonadaceae bacterium]
VLGMGFLMRLRAAVSGQASPKDAEEYVIRGFPVAVDNSARPDIEVPVVLRRLDEALGLIESAQPHRLHHLRHDLSGFLIVRYPCRGAFFPDERVCITELTFLARTDITAAPVAASIVHEGMHARAHAACRLGEPRDRAHEERICRRAELDFGRALPADLGAPVIERATASLELDDEGVAPTIDWNEAQRRQNAVDEAARRNR